LFNPNGKMMGPVAAIGRPHRENLKGATTANSRQVVE